MAIWKTLGLRGSALEGLIDRSNEYYLNAGVARIDKAATPVKVTRITDDGRIAEGYFEKKSTVDYYGIAQGVYISFDAKQTAERSFPLKNIHEHQIKYMRDVNAHGGVVFLIVEFTKNQSYYLLPFEILDDYYVNAMAGGRKSIPKSEFPEELRIELKKGSILKYIEAVNSYLDWKKEYNFE